MGAARCGHERTPSPGVGGSRVSAPGGPTMREKGLVVLSSAGRSGFRRRHNRLPEFREKWFYSTRPGRWVLWHWRPRVGYVVRAAGEGPTPGGDTLYEWGLEDEPMGFARRQATGDRLPQPQLSQDSKVLAKLPHLIAFVSDVQYEDKTPRVPGYFTLRNRAFTYEITLYDPDAGLRVAIRDLTLDGAFAAANELLRAPDAPWETDDYLMSQLSKKKRR